jgi:hypothetical protein
MDPESSDLANETDNLRGKPLISPSLMRLGEKAGLIRLSDKDKQTYQTVQAGLEASIISAAGAAGKGKVTEKQRVDERTEKGSAVSSFAQDMESRLIDTIREMDRARKKETDEMMGKLLTLLQNQTIASEQMSKKIGESLNLLSGDIRRLTEAVRHEERKNSDEHQSFPYGKLPAAGIIEAPHATMVPEGGSSQPTGAEEGVRTRGAGEQDSSSSYVRKSARPARKF